MTSCSKSKLWTYGVLRPLSAASFLILAACEPPDSHLDEAEPSETDSGVFEDGESEFGESESDISVTGESDSGSADQEDVASETLLTDAGTGDPDDSCGSAEALPEDLSGDSRYPDEQNADVEMRWRIRVDGGGNDKLAGMANGGQDRVLLGLNHSKGQGVVTPTLVELDGNGSERWRSDATRLGANGPIVDLAANKLGDYFVLSGWRHMSLLRINEDGSSEPPIGLGDGELGAALGVDDDGDAHVLVCQKHDQLCTWTEYNRGSGELSQHSFGLNDSVAELDAVFMPGERWLLNLVESYAGEALLSDRLVLVDTAGDFEWMTGFPSDQHARTFALAATADGSAVALVDRERPGQSDRVQELVGWSADGSLNWAVPLGGSPGSPKFAEAALAPGANGEVYLAGWRNRRHCGQQLPADATLRAFGPDGSLLWTHIQPSGGSVQQSSVSATAFMESGALITVGESRDESTVDLVVSKYVGT